MLSVQNILNFQKEVLTKINSPDWSYEEACEMGMAARNMRDLTNWVIGMVALGIEIKWGEHQLDDFAKRLGFDVKTIWQYRWVVKSFGSDYQPAEGYPWSYYRLAAGTDNPKETIAHFIDKDLTYKEADRYVKGLPLARECGHDYELVTFQRCKLCRILREMKES